MSTSSTLARLRAMTEATRAACESRIFSALGANSFRALCSCLSFMSFFFFFQAEDGIRDLIVTGVQTCALPIYTNFSSNVDDLVAAADFLRREHRAPALLVGHSLGGTAVLAAASRIPEAAAVATIGSPFDPDHVLGLIKDSVGKIDAEGDARIAIAGRDFRVKKQFLDDIRAPKIGAA